MWHLFRGAKSGQCSRTRDVLSGYIDRRLDPEESARVEHHLSECQGCRGELESLRTTVELLRSLPEVTPSRRFVLAPAKPFPGRRVLPALRYATAAAVLLLAAAFALDGTGVLEESRPSASPMYYGPAEATERDADHWLVAGVRNDIAGSENVTTTAVSLVVPDGSDNVYVAVNSLTAGGAFYATVGVGPEGAPQLVLTEDEQANGQDAARVYEVVALTDEDTIPFAPSGPDTTSTLHYILSSQEGKFLNAVPANGDNTVLYAFDLDDYVLAEVYEGPDGDSGARGESGILGGNDETQWLRPLQYGLIGLVAVLAGATVVLWLRQRRAIAQAAGHSRG